MRQLRCHAAGASSSASLVAAVVQCMPTVHLPMHAGCRFSRLLGVASHLVACRPPPTTQMFHAGASSCRAQHHDKLWCQHTSTALLQHFSAPSPNCKALSCTQPYQLPLRWPLRERLMFDGFVSQNSVRCYSLYVYVVQPCRRLSRGPCAHTRNGSRGRRAPAQTPWQMLQRQTGSRHGRRGCSSALRCHLAAQQRL